MKSEIRTVVYDDELCMEAYRFEGIMQPFPNHFHEYYVIGLVEAGQRRLSCRNKEYAIAPGNLILFNPRDNHSCAQSDGGTLDYRSLNISPKIMRRLAEEVTGTKALPYFTPQVVFDKEAARYLRRLHALILSGCHEFSKEENLLLLLSLLIHRYGHFSESCLPECRAEIENACAFMEQHYAERVSLDQICRHAGLSKSTLLRAFSQTKGVTPYGYLESIRINKAKELLEQGITPVEAAMRTGFSDQSHFTNYFSRFIGLTPGLYRDIFSDKGIQKEETPNE